MSINIYTLIQSGYLVAASLFIIGLHQLNSPTTARRGNLLAALGMLIAVVATLVDSAVVNYRIIFLGIAIGSLIGAASAFKVKMTAMPQMVGMLNGLGGGASALVATSEFVRLKGMSCSSHYETMTTILVGLLIGGVTFTGSMVAFGKLQGILRGAPTTFSFQQPLNGILLLAYAAGSIYILSTIADPNIFFVLVAISLALGVLLVIPIGGADMPVVISLLNSFSGLAASAAGFVLANNVLIIAGALVGASGLILTQLMSKAMNRSISHVLFGAFGGRESEAKGEAVGKTSRSIDVEEAAMMLAYANSVIIVPGYGMAVARAQHAVRGLAEQLEKRGVSVKYAIHPVAGRMPGHMNVLLAEADVPYTQLYEMEDINPEFERTDVALVVGASDVVNPAARHDTSSPIYGMPILDVDKARNIIVIKRSMRPGFSGIENELFYTEKTMMLFGDARETVEKLLSEVKQL